jgi:hypothetical protein
LLKALGSRSLAPPPIRVLSNPGVFSQSAPPHHFHSVGFDFRLSALSFASVLPPAGASHRAVLSVHRSPLLPQARRPRIWLSSIDSFSVEARTAAAGRVSSRTRAARASSTVARGSCVAAPSVLQFLGSDSPHRQGFVPQSTVAGLILLSTFFLLWIAVGDCCSCRLWFVAG